VEERVVVERIRCSTRDVKCEKYGDGFFVRPDWAHATAMICACGRGAESTERELLDDDDDRFVPVV